MDIAQLVQKRNERLGVCSVRRDVITDDVLTDSSHVHIISGLQLTVFHVVFLHVHKGCIHVGFAVAVPVATNVDIQVVTLQLFQPLCYGFNGFLQARLVVPFSFHKRDILLFFLCI